MYLQPIPMLYLISMKIIDIRINNTYNISLQICSFNPRNQNMVNNLNCTWWTSDIAYTSTSASSPDYRYWNPIDKTNVDINYHLFQGFYRFGICIPLYKILNIFSVATPSDLLKFRVEKVRSRQYSWYFNYGTGALRTKKPKNTGEWHGRGVCGDWRQLLSLHFCLTTWFVIAISGALNVGEWTYQHRTPNNFSFLIWEIWAIGMNFST